MFRTLIVVGLVTALVSCSGEGSIRMLKKASVTFSATLFERRDSRAFNGVPPSKMAAHPVPRGRQPKNRVFQQPASPAELPTAESVAFRALIRGAYEGEVSGSGVLRFLPGAGFDRAGYYFIADGQGIRSHGVTFVLPRGLTAGRYDLISPSPLELGTVVSVRVDRDMGDAVHASEEDTTGFLNLTAFPQDDPFMPGAPVEGDFEFETSDSTGGRITVSGEFAFEVE